MTLSMYQRLKVVVVVAVGDDGDDGDETRLRYAMQRNTPAAKLCYYTIPANISDSIACLPFGCDS